MQICDLWWQAEKGEDVLVLSAYCIESFFGHFKISFHLFEYINQLNCCFIEVKNQMQEDDDDDEEKKYEQPVIKSYF